MIKNLLGFICGIVYGIAMVIPGLSGGSMLVVFGFYDRVCAAFALDFKIIKKHFVFFVFFGTGAMAGILGFAKLISYLIEHYPMWTFLAFAVLIAAIIPSIVKTAFSHDKFTPACVVPLLLGYAVVVGMFLLEGAEKTATDAQTAMNAALFAKLIICSAIAAFAMLIPGISGSLMLVVFGIYETVTGALSDFNFTVLAPAVIGILLGLVFGAKLIVFLLGKFKRITYSAILGLVTGSAVILIISAFR
jgi:putative membrane protein